MEGRKREWDLEGMRRGGGREGQKGEWAVEGNRERMGRGRGV